MHRWDEPFRINKLNPDENADNIDRIRTLVRLWS